MSYDIQIWSVRAVGLPDAFPQAERWQREGDDWVCATKHWQIVASPCVSALFEDVPEAVASALPGIGYVTGLSLEPIGAPKRARELLHSTGRSLARAAHGVVLDRQTDLVTTPAGVQRYRRGRRADRFAIVALSWWFTAGPLLQPAGRRRFVTLLESTLPEGLPQRYGTFEPPQEMYAKTGREQFLSFLDQHLGESVVWYPQRPVVGVSLWCSPDWGAMRQGFRTNWLQILLEADCLSQPGWAAALKGFWHESSLAIEPFYGDVRTLRGFKKMGATYGSDMASEFHPVRGPWWTGIPRIGGQAVVLGEPYVGLWPRFVMETGMESGLAFLSTSDWTAGRDATEPVGGVPDRIAQRWVPHWVESRYGGREVKWNTDHPPVWPFQDGSGSGEGNGPKSQ